MELKLKKTTNKKAAPVIYKIYKKAFTRPFDVKVTRIKYVLDYLKDCATYLGYLGEKPVCYFSYKNTGKNTLEVETAGVLPENQRQGLGKKMMEYLIKLNPGKTIELVTHPKNVAALKLYLSLGFVITGWKDNFFGDGEPRLTLRRNV